MRVDRVPQLPAPLRIVYVTAYYKPAYVYGGPVRSDSALCEGLSKLGAEVTVLTTNANGHDSLEVPLGQPVAVDGVTVWYFPLLWRSRFFPSFGLARACPTRVPGCDLVVLGCFWTHAMSSGARACIHHRVPYVVPLRGQLLPWALRQKRWKKRLYMNLVGRRYLSLAAALHCSDPVEVEAVRALGLQVPTFVVPNSVDTSVFEHLPQRGKLRARLGIPSDAHVLLFLGRLNSRKRPDIALHTLAALQRLSPPVHLLFAGPDEERLAPGLQEEARRLGCRHRTHWAGLLEGSELLCALADADLLLMPSEVQESFGMAAAEALAAGVPVLASEEVPVGRWAGEAGAGQVVPCHSEAFIRAAQKLLQAPAGLKAMGERGRRLARERFDLRAVAAEVLRQYEAIVSTGKPLPEAPASRPLPRR